MIQEAEEATVIRCGPTPKCPDGSEHEYTGDVPCGLGAWTAVCAKCGHWAINDAMWMD